MTVSIGRRRLSLDDTTRQCTATAGSGERCKLPPIHGGFVCYLHGGSAPHVQEAARQRLAALVHPAVSALHDAVEADDMPTALRAAQLILSFAPGFGAQASLRVTTQPEQVEWTAWLTNEELSIVSGFITAAKQRMERGEPRYDWPAPAKNDVNCKPNSEGKWLGPVEELPKEPEK